MNPRSHTTRRQTTAFSGYHGYGAYTLELWNSMRDVTVRATKRFNYMIKYTVAEKQKTGARYAQLNRYTKGSEIE